MFGFQLTSLMGPFAATKLLHFPRVWMAKRIVDMVVVRHLVTRITPYPTVPNNPTPRRDEYA